MRATSCIENAGNNPADKNSCLFSLDLIFWRNIKNLLGSEETGYFYLVEKIPTLIFLPALKFVEVVRAMGYFE